jgi:hypothetical protein
METEGTNFKEIHDSFGKIGYKKEETVILDASITMTTMVLMETI